MMEYVEGDVMTIEGLDADRLCFWDITNALEAYLGYNYNDIPMLYYKYDIFPIAYTICETENKDTWTWFLRILLEDIGYSQEHMWSFMSDIQKVIFNAIVL
jgi:hypothetical protein